MPIVDVQLVMPPDRKPPDGLAGTIADALGEALGQAPGRVWVRLSALSSACYAENASSIDPSELPVFVSLIHAVPPEGVDRIAEAQVLCRTVAGCVGREARLVHLEYAPAGKGRIAFGGRLVV